MLLGIEVPAQALTNAGMDSQRRFFGVAFTLYGMLLFFVRNRHSKICHSAVLRVGSLLCGRPCAPRVRRHSRNSTSACSHASRVRAVDSTACHLVALRSGTTLVTIGSIRARAMATAVIKLCRPGERNALNRTGRNQITQLARP